MVTVNYLSIHHINEYKIFNFPDVIDDRNQYDLTNQGSYVIWHTAL